MNPCTAKSEVAHGNESLHGKVQRKRTAKKHRRQSPYTPHDKEILHGKGSGCCRGAPFAVRTDKLHGKDNIARQRLCRAKFATHTAMMLLPSDCLPCGRCRATTHGKSLCRVNRGLCGVICRMAMSCFPVVCVTFERLSKFWTTNVQKNFCFVTVYICPLGLLARTGAAARRALLVVGVEGLKNKGASMVKML
jgi:hypothetical protein